MSDVELLEYGGDVMPAPKFWTPRDPDAPTLGPRQQKFARVWLRKPLMTWQRLVTDVCGEQRFDEETGLWLPRYPLCVITLQRQGGKSHLTMAQNGERSFSRPGHRAWYTAQTGGDARDQFLKFHDDVVVGTPLERVVRTLRGNGHEVMTFPNTSTIRPHPPTETALHGKQSDKNDVDEGWAFTEEEGKAILQAVGPTQLTRPQAQTYVWSAGGTAASTWLAELVARGRAGDPSMAYFEWGIPDDLELDDLDLIARYHPAFGHTVTGASIRSLRSMLTDDAEFARAAGNRWTEIIGGAIPAQLWESVRYASPVPDEVPVGYGAARAADGSLVAIAAAAQVGDLVVAELVDLVPAYGAAQVVKVWATGETLAVDPTGASSVLVDDLEKLDVPLLPMTTRDASAACAGVKDALKPRAYRFRPHQALDDAVRVAGYRRVGNGGVAWAQTSAGASIAPLEAVTNAIWAVRHRKPAMPKPYVRGAA